MHTGSERLDDIFVAGLALYLGNMRRVWKVLDVRVAVRAPKNTVGAGGMFCRIDGDVLALVRLHSGRAVATQASFIPLLRLNFFRLCGSAGGSEHPRQRD